MELTGLTVGVFREVDFPDCTANGITSKVSRILLVDDSIEGPFKVGKDEVYLVLVRRNICGREYIHAEPRKESFEMRGDRYGMFGGNFIYTSDSRFPNSYPIPVHDRFETLEEYEAFSR
jgi:hypothetical protein